MLVKGATGVHAYIADTDGADLRLFRQDVIIFKTT